MTVNRCVIDEALYLDGGLTYPGTEVDATVFAQPSKALVRPGKTVLSRSRLVAVE